MLDGTKVTYSAWVKLFTLHAKGYKVLHHIDGTASPKENDPTYETWVEIDSIVLQWIYGTLADDILTRVLETNTTARNAWLKIREIFLNNKGVRAAALEQQFTNLTLSSCSSLDEYCKKLKDLAEQLGDVEHEVTESPLVTQLVRGLPPEYDITASLINQKSPGWDIATTMLDLERQRLEARQQSSTSNTVLTAATGANSQPPNGSQPPGNPTSQPTYYTRLEGQKQFYRGTSRGRGYCGRNSRGRHFQPQIHGPNQQPQWTWNGQQQ